MSREPKRLGALGTVIMVLVILGIIAGILGILAVITNLGASFPFLTVGIPAIPSLYFDWFGGCIQAFIFCTLTTLFIKQAADG